MGQAVSTKEESSSTPAEVREQLFFLVTCANSKLDGFQHTLEDMFVDSESVGKRSVPGRRALRWSRGYRVGVSESTAPEAVKVIISEFFGAAAEGDIAGQKILASFQAQIEIKVGPILRNTNAGEQSDEMFFVFVQHNAIVRIDVKLWKYNFSSNKVMAEAQNAMCYVFCESVVDHSKLTLDELTFLLSEHAGDLDVGDYIDELVWIWWKMRAITGSDEPRRPTRTFAKLVTPAELKSTSEPNGQPQPAQTGATAPKTT